MILLRFMVALAAVGCVCGVEAVPSTKQSFDFGIAWPSTTVRHKFVFTNNGATAWTVVSQSSACSCSVVEDLVRGVPAGGQLTVPIAFAIDRNIGDNHYGEIVVRVTDGQGTPHDLVCSFKARGEASLILPGNGRLSFPPVAPEGPASTRREMVRRGLHPAEWDRLEARVIGGGEMLTVQASPSTEQPGDWNLDLTLTPKRIAGVVLARVELVCWNGATPLPKVEALTLALSFEGPVLAEPGSVLIGAVPAQEQRTIVFAVRRRDGEGAVRIGTMISSDPLRCAVRVDEEGHVQMTFSATGKAGQASGWIDVSTDLGLLRVPYFAAVVVPGADAK